MFSFNSSFYTTIKLFGQLIFLIKPYWGFFLKAMIPIPIIGLLDLLIPYISKLLFDQVYQSADFNLMHIIVLSIFLFSISSTLLRGFKDNYSVYFITKLKNIINLYFFNHVQHLNINFFETHQVGDITNRFQNSSSAIDNILLIYTTVFIQGFYIVVIPFIIFSLSPKLALISIISVPITVCLTILMGKWIRRFLQATTEAYAEYNAFQIEMLSNFKSLKLLALESFVFKKSKEKLSYAWHLNLKFEGLNQLTFVLSSTFFSLNTALYTWIGWDQILSHEITLGAFLAFTMYINLLFNPIFQFVNLSSIFFRISVDLNRMFECLSIEPEQDPTLAYTKFSKVIKKVKGNYEFDNVSFGYNKGKKVLEKLNFKIDSESVFLISGPNGSGKSTIIKLMTRLEKPDSGKILLDNFQIHEIAPLELRSQIGVVLQEFPLYKGSIWENITYGLHNISHESVEEIIDICKLEELVEKDRRGYIRSVAEGGTNLSGGQRQRLAIARALVRDTPIIIVDEPTSNIDPDTEVELLKNLCSFTRKKGKTLVLISNSNNSMKLADKICFLDRGKISQLSS